MRTYIDYNNTYSYAFKRPINDLPTPWYIRAALWFCDEQSKTADFEPMHSQKTYYKVLFGETYLIRTLMMPPRAFMCRCSVVPIVEVV